MATANIAPAVLVRLPIALRIPDDCWTRILQHCQFNYKELKQVTRVCKKIQKCVKGKILGGIIFRLGPVPPKPFNLFDFPRGDPVPIHPVLQILCTAIFTKLSQVIFLAEDPEENYLTDYPTILDEFATSPASTEIRVEFKRVHPFILKDPKGITVRQLLVGIGRFWSSKPPSDVVRRIKRSDYSNEDEDGPVTWLHVLKGEESWDCWEGAIAQPAGFTTLKARDTFD